MAVSQSTRILSEHLCRCGCGEFTFRRTSSDLRRGHVAGEPSEFLVGHNFVVVKPPRSSVEARAAQQRGRRLKSTVKGYRTVPPSDMGGHTLPLHRVLAERALGHPLPPGAVVHHADGTRGESSALVICQDNGYHLFLHARMRVQAAGGNPNTDKICARCKVAKPLDQFTKCRVKPRGHSNYCFPCERQRVREAKKARRAKRVEGD